VRHSHAYRLRVGDWRILFDLIDEAPVVISIEEVKNVMNTHTETQIIRENGVPAFAVIPWAEFEAIKPALERHRSLRDGIPHAVAMRIAMDGVHPVRAWREHLGVTQTEVAAKALMQQSALARIEAAKGSKPGKKTLKRLATVMDLNLAQIDLLDDEPLDLG